MTMAAMASRQQSAEASAPSPWTERGPGAARDRLPLLEDTMGEVARALTEGLASLSASPGEVVFGGLHVEKTETLLDRRGPGAVLAIAHASAWTTPIAIHFDRTLVSTVVEAFFGGAGEEVQVPESPHLSAIETGIAEVICEQVLAAMKAGFAQLLPTSFSLEPFRAKPDPTPLGKPATTMLVATLVLRGIGEPAGLDVVIPGPALDLLKDRLTASPRLEDAPRDPEWSDRLEAEIARTTMHLQAVIAVPPMNLRDLAELRTGHILALPAGSKGNIGLTCGGDPLFRCELGQSAGFYTVRIEEALEGAASPSRKDG